MKKIIGVIGSSEALTTKEMYDFTQKMTTRLASMGYSIVCGGLGGVMEAAAKGVKQAQNTDSKAICIIPQADKKYANQYCDFIIPTGMGECRNLLIIRTADIIVAIGGGAGTLSELAFAWQNNKYVICITQFRGWAQALAGEEIDSRTKGLLVPANNIEDVIEKINTLIN